MYHTYNPVIHTVNFPRKHIEYYSISPRYVTCSSHTPVYRREYYSLENPIEYTERSVRTSCRSEKEKSNGNLLNLSKVSEEKSISDKLDRINDK